MKKYNLINGFIYLGLALFMVFESFRLELGEVRSPGAGFFPFLTAIPLGVLAIILILNAVSKSVGKEEVNWPTKKNRRKIIMTLSALAVYTLCLSYLGYFMSTFILLFWLLKGIEPQKWSTAFLIAVISVVATYFIFGQWLDVPLPEGFWKG
jgi:ABC-type Fe3+-siderophore transport system permease subunit